MVRLPGLLFRRPAQLLHYTAALHSPFDGTDQDQDDAREHLRGELSLLSRIGNASVIMLLSACQHLF